MNIFRKMNIRRDPKIHPVGRSVTCYFCSELFEEKLLHDHLIQCGAVLEPCPKKCGVYIPRSVRDKHIAECKYRKPFSRAKSTYELAQNEHATPNPLEYLEMELIKLRTAYAEEKRHRQETQMEIQRLQKLYQKSEEMNQYLVGNVETLKRNWFEETEKRKTGFTQLKLEVDKNNLQYQVFDGWKKQVDASVDFTKNRLIETENKILDAEFALKNHENRMALIDQLELDLNMLRQKTTDDHFQRQEDSMSWRGELNEFKGFFAQENAMISALWGDHRHEIDDLKKAMEVQANVIGDLKAKHQSVVFDTKSVTQMAMETAERFESQRSDVKQMKSDLEQLKQDLKLLETAVSNSTINIAQNGRLLWRIDNFKNKMDSAKEHNTILRSPVFYSSLNGYKLRIEVHLNGIGKWRGRHIILSLQVLKGDWDPLLTWPCGIEAKVILRNQSKPQAKDYTKYITAKRAVGNEENEDPQESSSQYIFITHATLEKEQFIKDDTVFLEINILNDNYHGVRKTEVTTL